MHFCTIIQYIILENDFEILKLLDFFKNDFKIIATNLIFKIKSLLSFELYVT